MDTRNISDQSTVTPEKPIASPSNADLPSATEKEETHIASTEKSMAEALTYTTLATLGTHSIDVKNTRAIFNTTGGSNWVGLRSNFFANLAKAWVLFDSLSEFEKILGRHMDPTGRLGLEILSGVLAMSLEGVVWTPFSYANMKMRIDHAIKGYWQAFTAESPKNTLKALGRGAVIGGAFRNPIYASIFFGITKEEEQLDEKEQNLFLKIGKTTATSAGAGMVASVFSYPWDLIQKWGMANPSTPLPKIVSQQWESFGVKGFYKDYWRTFYRMPIIASAFGFTIAAKDCGVFDSISKNTSTLFNSMSNRIPSQPLAMPSSEEMIQASVGIDYTGNRFF